MSTFMRDTIAELLQSAIPTGTAVALLSTFSSFFLMSTFTCGGSSSSVYFIMNNLPSYLISKKQTYHLCSVNERGSQKEKSCSLLDYYCLQQSNHSTNCTQDLYNLGECFLFCILVKFQQDSKYLLLKISLIYYLQGLLYENILL